MKIGPAQSIPASCTIDWAVPKVISWDSIKKIQRTDLPMRLINIETFIWCMLTYIHGFGTALERYGYDLLTDDHVWALIAVRKTRLLGSVHRANYDF